MNLVFKKNNFFFWCMLFAFLFSGLKPVGQSVGISLFDFFSLIGCIYLVYIISNYNMRVSSSLFLPLMIVCIYPIFLFLLYNDAYKFFYAIRFLEYSIWFLLAYLVKDYLKLIKYLTIILSLLLVSSKFTGLKFGYFNYVWEVSAFASIAAAVFVSSINKSSKELIIYILIVLFISISTGQRTPIVATLLTFGYVALSKGYLDRNIKTVVVLVMLTAVFLVMSTENRLIITILDVFNEGNYDALKIIYNNSHSYNSYDDFVYNNRALVGGGGDLSLQLRLKKWLYATKDMLNNDFSFIFGLGAGYFGGAADSSFVRVFFEFGLVGLFFWGVFFWNIIKVDNRIKVITLCFLLNAVFIDTLYSSRIMVLFLILSGSIYFNKKMGK